MSQPEPTQRNSPVELAPVVLAPGGAPDIYIDGIQVNASYVGVNLLLQRGMPPNGVPHVVGIVHMSPQQAFLLAQVLRRLMISYQEQFGVINLPDEILTSLGVSKEL